SDLASQPPSPPPRPGRRVARPRTTNQHGDERDPDQDRSRPRTSPRVTRWDRPGLETVLSDHRWVPHDRLDVTRERGAGQGTVAQVFGGANPGEPFRSLDAEGIGQDTRQT